MHIFQMQDLFMEQALAAPRWHEFLRSPALYAGIYELPGGGRDPQSQHAEDEAYYALEGK